MTRRPPPRPALSAAELGPTIREQNEARARRIQSDEVHDVMSGACLAMRARIREGNVPLEALEFFLGGVEEYVRTQRAASSPSSADAMTRMRSNIGSMREAITKLDAVRGGGTR